MDGEALPFRTTPLSATTSGILFTTLFVGSFYLWRHDPKFFNRDASSVIKRRFFSIALVSIISPLYCKLWFTGDDILPFLGIRMEGLLPALFLPLLLTMVLFAGPLTMLYYEGLAENRGRYGKLTTSNPISILGEALLGNLFWSRLTFWRDYIVVFTPMMAFIRRVICC